MHLRSRFEFVLNLNSIALHFVALKDSILRDLPKPKKVEAQKKSTQECGEQEVLISFYLQLIRYLDTYLLPLSIFYRE